MDEQVWGLVALGRAGQVELSIDESDSDPTTYVMTISLPLIELRFTIQDPHAALEFSRFLSEYANRQVFTKQQIGNSSGMPLELIKDSEFSDRFYLRAAAIGMIDVSIIDPVTNDLVQAAIQLAHDITSETEICAAPPNQPSPVSCLRAEPPPP
ncbi:MAG: hypothetical protein ABSH20_15110 [Tepidisphaeraceae bacterium]|jgi:hypothetical protein